MKPKALDLFCGAGGASMGIYRSGFDVTGIDIRDQPNYPFNFKKLNAMDAELSGFDFVWASPPCQAYTRMSKGLLKSLGSKNEYPDLINHVREKLQGFGGKYVIENVVGAPLINPIMLCGSSFGLMVQRHRLFESNVMLFDIPCCHGIYTKNKHPLHRLQGKFSRVVGCYGNSRGKGDNLKLRSLAMGIDWMRMHELNQAIPPAYSEFIARQIRRILNNTTNDYQQTTHRH